MACECRRWFIRTCLVCFLTCVFVLGCCIFGVHIADSVRKEIAGCRQPDLQRPEAVISNAMVVQRNERNGQPHEPEQQVELRKPVEDISIQRIRRNVNRRGGKGGGKGKGKGGGKKEKVKAARYIPVCNQRNGCNNPKKSNDSKSLHFIAEGVTPNFVRVMQIFERDTSSNEKSAPFNLLHRGKFEAKKTGVYYVQAQILFKNSGVKMTPNAFGLQHYRPDKNDTYVVQTSYCRHDMSIGSDKDITCSVTSLFFMKKNDYISVVNVYPDNEYEFYSTTTFLNAFMLK